MSNLTSRIVVHNVHGWELDQPMLQAVLHRCAVCYVGRAELVDVYPAPPAADGSLMWIIRIKWFAPAPRKTDAGGWSTDTVRRNGDTYKVEER